MSYHPEEMKLILEELCTAAGVTVRFHTRVVAAHRDGRWLSTIVTESKSGHHIRSRFIVQKDDLVMQPRSDLLVRGLDAE